MKRTSKLLSILLAICLVALLLPLLAGTALADGDLPVWAANAGITSDYATWDGTTSTLTLTKDIKTTAALGIPNGTTAILDLNGYVLERDLSSAESDGCVIKVGVLNSLGGSIDLTIKDSRPTAPHLNGNEPIYTYTVGDDTWEITGGIITGGKNSNTSSDSGTRGGGLFLAAANGCTTTVTLEGGTIFGNTAKYGGGVLVTNNTIFNMYGGTICGNTANNSGDGGGVYLKYGTFNMSGGTIADNTSAEYGGGVHMSSGAFNLSGGTISGNSSAKNGIAVYINSGSFTMTGGAICDNSALKNGTVYLYGSSATFNMSGGAIRDNYADNGGAVSVSNGTFNMSGTASFYDNTAEQNGGGVHLSGGTFNMSGSASIRGNDANYGGGVHMNDGTFVMSGTASIVSNECAAEKGGGVNVWGGTFQVGGNVLVKNNTRKTGPSTASNIYLSQGKCITVTDELKCSNGSICVTAPYGGTITSGLKNGGNGATDQAKADAARLKFACDAAGATLTLTDDNEACLTTPWNQLQKDLENGVSNIVLEADCLGEEAGVLVVPVDKKVTLDLNGHLVDRGLKGNRYGYVIKVEGDLTIIDNGETPRYGYWLSSTKYVLTSTIPTSGTYDTFLTGGVITGGNHNQGLANVNSGSGINVAAGGSLTLSGGAIAGNYGSAYDSGVFVYTGGSFNMDGGTIAGNRTSNGNGGVTVYEGAEFIFSNGKICNNVGGVYVNGGTFNFSGGAITDNRSYGVYYSRGTLNFSGNPTITGSYVDTVPRNVYLGNSGLITITGELTGEPNTIGVTMGVYKGAITSGFTTYNVENDALAVFVSDAEDVEFMLLADGEVGVPSPWYELQAAFNKGGSIKLEKNYSAEGQPALVVPAGKEVNLDLNGYAIDRGLLPSSYKSSGYVIRVEGKLTISDSGKTYRYGYWSAPDNYTLTTTVPSSGTYDTFDTGGIITGGYNTSSGDNCGACICVGSTGELKLNGGAIAGNKGQSGGSGVYVLSGGKFTMNGGTIAGNYISSGSGGGVNVHGGTFEMNGGFIRDNKGYSNGGGVYVDSGTFSMNGGSITDNICNITRGSCYGGGVYVNGGTFNVSGGATVTDNLKDGNTSVTSNVYLPTGKTITVTGALTDGAAIGITANSPQDGPVVAVAASAYNSGKLAEADVSKLSYDGGEYTIMLNSEGKAIPAKEYSVSSWNTLKTAMEAGGKITLTEDVYAAADDVALEVPEGKTATLDLNGHTIDRGLTTPQDNGYVIKVSGNLTLNDSSAAQTGVITGGNTTNYGGGVYVSSGSLTMTGGTITGNHARPSGGGVYIAGDGRFTMSGGAIAGNDANNGGGAYLNGGTLDLQGTAEICGNRAMDGGNDFGGLGGGVYISSGTLNVSGGAIHDNSADKIAGGVNMSNNTTFNMSGGTIRDNRATTAVGGVFISGDSAFSVSDGATVTGNKTYDGSLDNVRTKDSQIITVAGALSGTIGVRAENPAPGDVVAKSSKDYYMTDADVAQMVYDGGAYAIVLDTTTKNAVLAAAAYTVTFDANAASARGTMPPQKLPVGGAPLRANAFTRDGYEFVNWNTATDGSGTAYADGAKVNTNLTLYAQWNAYQFTVDAIAEKTVGDPLPTVTVRDSVTGEAIDAANYAVVFRNAAGDEVEALAAAGTYQAVVTPTQDGDYCAAEAVTVEFTVKAKSGGNPGYVPSAGTSTTYTPTVAPSDHGSVKSSPEAPKEGEKVTVTLTPDEGYEVESVTVTGPDGKPVEVTKNADGTYSFTQPKGKVEIRAVFAEKKAETPAGLTAAELLKRFPDLDPNGWYLDNVLWAVSNGVMQGTDKGFEPGKSASRAMIVTILYRLEGEPVIRSGMPFADVTESDWFAKAVSWAESLGIVNGFEDGTFRPGAPITREQLAAILYRYAQYKGKGFEGLWSFKLDFPDAGEVSDWANEAVSWMVMNGIINGATVENGATILDPQGSATRAQIAAMVQRFCAKLAG